MDGSLVRELADDSEFPAGRHTVVWNGLSDQARRVAGGVYFVRVAAGSHQAIQKIIRIQ